MQHQNINQLNARQPSNYHQKDKGNLHRINHQIKAPLVRVVHEQTQNGIEPKENQNNHAQETSEILPLKKALELSIKLGVDLVEIAPKANPPVCKLLNYGKFLYREQKNQKREKHTKSKEIGCHINIAEHDLNTKIKQAHDFLQHSHQVVFKVAFRGRETIHKDLGLELLETISKRLLEVGNPDGRAKLNGKVAMLRFSPKKQNKS